MLPTPIDFSFPARGNDFSDACSMYFSIYSFRTPSVHFSVDESPFPRSPLTCIPHYSCHPRLFLFSFLVDLHLCCPPVHYFHSSSGPSGMFNSLAAAVAKSGLDRAVDDKTDTHEFLPGVTPHTPYSSFELPVPRSSLCFSNGFMVLPYGRRDVF